MLLDIDAGTVIIGASGSNDDITFDDDGDEITVASGATLTTFGSFAVVRSRREREPGTQRRARRSI